MTDQPSNPVNDRLDALEVDMRDVKAALNQLIDFTYQNQRQTAQQMDELRQISSDNQRSIQSLTEAVRTLTEAQLQTFARIDEMQSEVRGLQTENRRIWEILLNQRPDEPLE